MKQGKPLELEELIERRRLKAEKKLAKLERIDKAARLILSGEKLVYIAAIMGMGEQGINRIKSRMGMRKRKSK